MNWISTDFGTDASQDRAPSEITLTNELAGALLSEAVLDQEAFLVVHGLQKPDTPAEIAARYGMSRQHVYNRAKSVRNRLRKRFA